MIRREEWGAMSAFLGVLPFAFFALCALVFLLFHNVEEEAADLRVVLVAACVVSSVWMVAGPELLSVCSG